jgi:uncharacterized membrane protein YfcA
VPPHPSILSLLAVGLAAGVAAGFFGIGGGLIVIPALIYALGYSQHRATGTSLAILLPPVGIIGVLEYYRQGNVDFRAALIVAMAMIIGGGIGAVAANRMGGPYLRLAFGVFTVAMGISLIVGAVRRLEWL